MLTYSLQGWGQPVYNVALFLGGLNMSLTDNQKRLAELELENRKLREENHQLHAAIDGKKVPFSDDAVDGIVWLVVIGTVVSGVVFWLSYLPTS